MQLVDAVEVKLCACKRRGGLGGSMPTYLERMLEKEVAIICVEGASVVVPAD